MTALNARKRGQSKSRDPFIDDENDVRYWGMKLDKLRDEWVTLQKALERGDIWALLECEILQKTQDIRTTDKTPLSIPELQTGYYAGYYSGRFKYESTMQIINDIISRSEEATNHILFMEQMVQLIELACVAIHYDAQWRNVTELDTAFLMVLGRSIRLKVNLFQKYFIALAMHKPGDVLPQMEKVKTYTTNLEHNIAQIITHAHQVENEVWNRWSRLVRNIIKGAILLRELTQDITGIGGLFIASRFLSGIGGKEKG